MTQHPALGIPFWSDEEIAAAIRPALEQIELRRVLAYPTETVYGFGGIRHTSQTGSSPASSRTGGRSSPSE